jgi:hypothetical protein
MQVILRAYIGNPVIRLRVLQIWQSCCRTSKAKYLLSSPSILFLCRVSFMEAGQEINNMEDVWHKSDIFFTSRHRAHWPWVFGNRKKEGRSGCLILEYKYVCLFYKHTPRASWNFNPKLLRLLLLCFCCYGEIYIYIKYIYPLPTAFRSLHLA